MSCSEINQGLSSHLLTSSSQRYASAVRSRQPQPEGTKGPGRPSQGDAHGGNTGEGEPEPDGYGRFVQAEQKEGGMVERRR